MLTASDDPPCYLRTHLGLHDLRLLRDALLAEQVGDEVLGGRPALLAGDGLASPGNTSCKKEDKERLETLERLHTDGTNLTL